MRSSGRDSIVDPVGKSRRLLSSEGAIRPSPFQPAVDRDMAGRKKRKKSAKRFMKRGRTGLRSSAEKNSAMSREKKSKGRSSKQAAINQSIEWFFSSHPPLSPRCLP